MEIGKNRGFKGKNLKKIESRASKGVHIEPIFPIRTASVHL